MTEEKEQKNEAPAKLLVSSSPHAHSGSSVRGIMLDVVIALIPAMAAAVFYFQMNAVRLIAACVLSSLAVEYGCRKLMGRDKGIGDLSAVVTGILLALNLPLIPLRARSSGDRAECTAAAGRTMRDSAPPRLAATAGRRNLARNASAWVRPIFIPQFPLFLDINHF